MTKHTLRPLNVVSNIERYGSVVGEPHPDRAFRIAKAIKIIIAADGDASDAEMAAFADLGTLFGVSQAQLAAFEAFDPRGAKLEDCLEGLGHDALSRRMIYDAVKISSVDGYHAKEREAVHQAARILGVSPGTVALIEGLVVAEAGLAEMRARLLGAEQGG